MSIVERIKDAVMPPPTEDQLVERLQRCHSANLIRKEKCGRLAYAASAVNGMTEEGKKRLAAVEAEVAKYNDGIAEEQRLAFALEGCRAANAEKRVKDRTSEDVSRLAALRQHRGAAIRAAEACAEAIGELTVHYRDLLMACEKGRKLYPGLDRTCPELQWAQLRRFLAIAMYKAHGQSWEVAGPLWHGMRLPGVEQFVADEAFALYHQRDPSKLKPLPDQVKQTFDFFVERASHGRAGGDSRAPIPPAPMPEPEPKKE